MSLVPMIAALAQTAYAQDGAAAPKGPSMVEMLIMPLGFLAIMYLFVIKPQQKRAKDQESLISGLKAGDEVVTSGGIIGRVRSVAESFVTLEVSQNTSLKVLKANVQALANATKQPAKEG